MRFHLYSLSTAFKKWMHVFGEYAECILISALVWIQIFWGRTTDPSPSHPTNQNRVCMIIALIINVLKGLFQGNV